LTDLINREIKACFVQSISTFSFDCVFMIEGAFKKKKDRKSFWVRDRGDIESKSGSLI